MLNTLPNIILVRHTRPAVAAGICYGQSDIDINDIADIEALLKELPPLSSPIVYSSPLVRCRRLAEAISSNVQYDSRLMELNFGDWELKPWDKITGPDAERWFADFVKTPCPGGESFVQLAERVQSFLSEIQNTYNEQIVIVCHAGVIRAILSILKNISIHDSFNILMNYGYFIDLQKCTPS